MTIHKEGYTTIALCILFVFVSNALIQFYIPQVTSLRWIMYIFTFVLFVATLWFFRSPAVDVVADEKAILSPADGKVVSIEDVTENEYLKAKGTRVSIAIAPQNEHVNRNPVKGIVKYVKHDGHTTVAVETAAGKAIVYRQIPGALSKRVIMHVAEGDAVAQGAKFGFTMLGSRVDVFLPEGTSINVDIDDVVKGGQTVLGQFKS